MKQFIWAHLFFLLALACTVGGAVSFGIQGNWSALVWAIFAGSYVGLFLRERIYYERLEKKYYEHLVKENEEK